MNLAKPIVTIENLSKRFGKIQALDGVSMEVNRGHIIGLLGANGCGKSTLLRHMIGLYLADSGGCTTFGCDAAKLGPQQLVRIGYVHQEGQLLDWMTVAQHLRYVQAYYDNWNMELQQEYIEDFEIDLKARVGSLSPGQRQKVAVLLAIGFDPELLILDEPASGLDPLARGQFLDLLLKIIQDASRTILISSHILSDVEKVIDHAIIMKQGRILRDCGFDELREEYVRVRLTRAGEQFDSASLPVTVVSLEKSLGQAIIICEKADLEKLKQLGREKSWEVEAEALDLEEIYKVVMTQNGYSRGERMAEVAS